MDIGTQLFLWFAGTIILCRIFLLARPTSSPSIWGFRLHHWMYGAVGIVLSLMLGSLILFSIGLGLFVDELALIIVHKRLEKANWAAYHSPPSTLGTLFFMAVIFLLKDCFAAYFL